jgi:hypothetical protein
MMASFADFLSRIQTDYAFYLRFQENPEEALKFYELSAEERTALTKPGRQLWDLLGPEVRDAELLKSGKSGDPDATPKWRMCTTQTWWAKTDVASSLDLQSNHEAVFGLPEVPQTVAQIYAASTHHDRLAAVSALIEQIE